MTTQTIESIDGYFKEMQTILADVPRESILMNVLYLYQAWEQRKQVFLLGNGGSASTASHMANDLSKATIVPGKPRMKVIALTDNVSVITAWANDTSYDRIFREQLENLLDPGDTVLGISASGNSPNVLRAMEFAAERGAVTIGWTGLAGGRLKDIVDHCVHAPTDDVGMIESIHLVIDHLVSRELYQCIQRENMDWAEVRETLTVASGDTQRVLFPPLTKKGPR
jgi:D-sedoheptulose 7-phosphate isomerase